MQFGNNPFFFSLGYQVEQFGKNQLVEVIIRPINESLHGSVSLNFDRIILTEIILSFDMFDLFQIISSYLFNS